ncbi:hypothetical protein L211DRAFT_868536 [Terfezia boudieri ATCC MYA-4762]|uniref:Uncharacterized protein n=1 Tax=Terfezia boudieri ATCC MYA-4762 TaxID=1051890 RepID=A0A3N4LQ62_9PEZI|nr:hypothetical protein L211DRAFT_868536 [Terfezia boudieri ATCC MYA-4762]
MIIDSNLADHTPLGYLDGNSRLQWLVIVTSSPTRTNFKRFQKAVSPQVYYMPAWSWGEVVVASGIREDYGLQALWKFYFRYGPIARLLLQDLDGNHSPEFLRRVTKAYELNLEDKITEVLKHDPSTWSLDNFGIHDSRAIILLKPKISPARGVPKLSSVTFVHSIITPEIGRRMGIVAGERVKEKAHLLYNFLLGSPYTTSAAGWIFEGRGHNIFHMGASYTATLLTPLHRLRENYDGFNDDSKLAATFRKGLSRFNRNLSNLYLMPTYSNLGGVDSLVITLGNPDSGQPRAIFFQFTVAQKHPVSAHSMSKIWDCLPAEVKRVPPALVFVQLWTYERSLIFTDPISHHHRLSGGYKGEAWCHGLPSIGLIHMSRALRDRDVGDMSAQGCWR